MNLESYEMALIKLYYHDDYVNNFDGQLLPVERSGEPFFDLSLNQNVVWLNQLKISNYNVGKTYPYLHTFVNGLNAHMNRFGVKSKFTVEFAEGGIPTKVTLEYTFDFGYKLFLGDNLNTILGFSGNDFDEGTYTSDLPLNLEEFEKLPATTVFRIEKRKWVINKIILEQLYDPTLDDICISISAGCAKKGFTVQAVVDEEENTLTINTFEDNIYVTLSSFLNQYLKIPWRTEFKNSTTVTVPRNVINPYEPFARTYLKSTESLRILSPNKIFVVSTLCTQHFYESKQLPYLQVFNRTEGRQEITFEANPPIYIQVSPFETSTINIKLLDDNLNLLPIRDEPTVCLLHFKKKWL